MRLRPDSGGAGRFRGGLGTEQVVQARHTDPLQLADGPRARCKPWGLFGGLSGLGNAVAVHRFGKTDETHFPNGKALNQVLQPGDAYILRSGGGGGFGSPLERDLAALEHDVRCGYVTKEAAETRLRRGVRAGLAQARHRGDRNASRRDGATGPAARRADHRDHHSAPRRRPGAQHMTPSTRS